MLIAATLVLAKYKVPKRLFFVDALPRNAMGKVLTPCIPRATAESAQNWHHIG